MGIGIGAASSIPQFNIKEVNHALEVLLLNPDATFDDIYCAPDFATGALLLNEKEVKEALKTGQGSACKLRSVVEWDSAERSFIVSQIPYSVYTNTICEELEEILVLVVLLKEPFIESALFGCQIQEFLVVESASELFSEHSSYLSASTSQLAPDIDNDSFFSHE